MEEESLVSLLPFLGNEKSPPLGPLYLSALLDSLESADSFMGDLPQIPLDSTRFPPLQRQFLHLHRDVPPINYLSPPPPIA
jgi:hypothetical protein